MPSPASSDKSPTTSDIEKILPRLLRCKSTTELRAEVRTWSQTQRERWLSYFHLLSKLSKQKLAQEDPQSFMEEVLELKCPQHMREWLSLLNKEKYLVVQASRDHGKSFVFSYAWPLFNIQRIRDPKQAENIALISYSEDQARKNLLRIRRAIETRDSLKWLMPKSKAYVWEAAMLNMSNECSVEVFGFGSSVRGGHYHKIIIDDPEKDTFTQSVEDKQNFIFGVILPALRRGGQLIVTGNPVGKHDLFEVLESNSEFKTFKYPVINEKNEPLWPDQYTLEDIQARRRQIPAHTFAREYLLKRISSQEAKFKEEWIQFYAQAPRNLFKVMTIDPAYSPGGDALAAVITGTDEKLNTYVIDRISFRGDLNTGISQLIELMVAHQPNRIGFETFAFQKMYKIILEDEMTRRGLWFHIEELARDTKTTKAMRIERLQPKLMQRKLFFRQEHTEIIDQLLMWDPAGQNNTDDEIDALAYQVGMWQKPYGTQTEEQPKVRPGTMGAAIREINQRTELSWLGKLFEDLPRA